MKNLLFFFVFLFAFSLSNNLKAQDVTNINEVEILTNFQASKKQKSLSEK